MNEKEILSSIFTDLWKLTKTHVIGHDGYTDKQWEDLIREQKELFDSKYSDDIAVRHLFNKMFFDILDYMKEKVK